MIISDEIAKIIEEMLEDGGGSTKINRNDLAGKIGCVPSQINYVITSRFTPQRGYVIESRRGGGGYIRIIRKQMGKNEYLMHLFQSIGKELTTADTALILEDLYSKQLISGREYSLINRIINYVGDDGKRSDAIRSTLLAIMD